MEYCVLHLPAHVYDCYSWGWPYSLSLSDTLPTCEVAIPGSARRRPIPGAGLGRQPQRRPALLGCGASGGIWGSGDAAAGADRTPRHTHARALPSVTAEALPVPLALTADPARHPGTSIGRSQLPTVCQEGEAAGE